jgi:hypothetical protein
MSSELGGQDDRGDWRNWGQVLTDNLIGERILLCCDEEGNELSVKT